MYKQCETEQSAARQRAMEQGLLEMMGQRRYEDISVSDLCAFLGVPRKTFYRYFSGKDGALFSLIDHILMGFSVFMDPASSPGRGDQLAEMEAVFRFWKEKDTFLTALEKSGLSGILVERAIRYSQSQTVFPSFLSLDEQEQRDYTMKFAVCGLMSIVIQWHSDGFPQSPGHMAKIALRLLGKPLFSKAEQYFE